ncbi:MAG: PBP1A family penicillin-binding protein [Elusimicrobia bacterium]|nr:PBP1A family penicillin-binding protein [Candidatus Liberimonas magnetica]
MKNFINKLSPKKIAFIVISLAFIFSSTAYIRYIIKDLPSIYSLEDYTPDLVTKIYDINGQPVTELFTERRALIPLKDIPIDLQNALLSIEDDKFFHHWGISLKGILRAAVNNIIKRKVAQGGSTITQQLAKIVFLTPERTFSRKLKELILTLQLEYHFTKSEILQLYLNQIYFGSGGYGAKAAAKVYFNKEISDLNLAECALLSGLVRAPNYYSPFKNYERALQRRSVVLKRMKDLKQITEEQEKAANEYPLINNRIPNSPAIAPYFVEYIRVLLEPKYGKLLYSGGLSIYTTLDIKAQLAAEEATSKYLAQFDQERLEQFILKKSTPVKVQCALLAIDPKTGGIRALVGGRNFRESQFNRALQAKRQPGSVFKPIIYTAALENGFTPTSIIDDSPLVYVNDGRNWRLVSRTTDYLATLPEEQVKDPMKVWSPANYKYKYNGKVTLRRALERSMNMCSIQILDTIGPNRAIGYARRLGITSPLTNTLSLALGSSEVTLLEITRAISVFANNGVLTEPYAIVRVEDNQGKVLEENIPQEREALSVQTCFIMTHLMEGVIQNGTGQAAKWIRRPAAGKTGTTNDFSDAWFLGFTPQLVAGVWVGYDDKSITLGEKNSGGKVAAPIWAEFIYGALKDKPVLDFKTPDSGIVFSLVEPKTGLLALTKTPGAYLEAYLKGTEPKDYYYQKEMESLYNRKELEEEQEEVPVLNSQSGKVESNASALPSETGTSLQPAQTVQEKEEEPTD